MEFAVIETGGKQYLVSEGTSVKIEKLAGEYKIGDAITFDRVLMTDDGKLAKVGMPALSGAKVTGTLEEIGRNKKVVIVKYKEKSNRQKKLGHRQHYFKVKITGIA
jgi:large subunit ribosomal protein L21